MLDPVSSLGICEKLTYDRLKDVGPSFEARYLWKMNLEIQTRMLDPLPSYGFMKNIIEDPYEDIGSPYEPRDLWRTTIRLQT